MANKQDLSARNNMVVKANELIQKSRFSLSIQQQKIVLYLISQIQPYDDDFKLYEFSIPEFCRVVGIESHSGELYNDLKKAVKEISDKSLWIQIGDTETLLRWIEKPYINKRSGKIQIRLDRDMKPFLLQLKKNFTQYELIWTLHFKSKYSIRLYELIKSIHYHELETYEREFRVDALRTAIGADTYEKFKDFHTRALKPAVNEINEYSDKCLSYELIKKGRKVISVRFTISTKTPLERMKIKDTVEKDLGNNQPTLWDDLCEKGMV